MHEHCACVFRIWLWVTIVCIDRTLRMRYYFFFVPFLDRNGIQPIFLWLPNRGWNTPDRYLSLQSKPIYHCKSAIDDIRIWAKTTRFERANVTVIRMRKTKSHRIWLRYVDTSNASSAENGADEWKEKSIKLIKTNFQRIKSYQLYSAWSHRSRLLLRNVSASLSIDVSAVYLAHDIFKTEPFSALGSVEFPIGLFLSSNWNQMNMWTLHECKSAKKFYAFGVDALDVGFVPKLKMHILRNGSIRIRKPVEKFGRSNQHQDSTKTKPMEME